MQKIVIVLLTNLIFACAGLPRTAQEFRDESKGGRAATRTERQVVDRPFLAVFEDIRDNSTKCLNIKASVPASGDAGVHKDLVRYRSYTKKISSKSAEMVLQADKQGSGNMPEGGYYTLLADIEAVSAQKTAVTIFGPSMLYGDVFDAVAEWAKGKVRICPSLP